MERFIVKFPNGKIRQQKGINVTYHHLLSIGAISYIIDVEKGTVMFADKDEEIQTNHISTYSSSDLIIPKG